jgi:Bacterial PH domain
MLTTTALPTETRIREIWPSVKRMPAIANLGKMLIKSILLAPLGWLVMSAVYFGKILPFVGVRYKLTDKRLMILHGWGKSPSQEVALSDIDDVQIDVASIDQFFRSADLKIMRAGQVAMTLTAVPDAAAFRHAILDSRNAWVPGKVKTLPFISAAAVK